MNEARLRAGFVQRAAVVIPTVHLNGTYKGRLMESLMEVLEALRVALKALYNATPNARDYDIREEDEGTYQQAIADHARRVRSIEVALTEIEEIVIGVDDQPSMGERP